MGAADRICTLIMAVHTDCRRQGGGGLISVIMRNQAVALFRWGLTDAAAENIAERNTAKLVRAK